MDNNHGENQPALESMRGDRERHAVAGIAALALALAVVCGDDLLNNQIFYDSIQHVTRVVGLGGGVGLSISALRSTVRTHMDMRKMSNTPE
jgi:hypothetical protein